MKSPILYILEMLFCSGLFLLLYHVLLSGRIPLAACRRYLLGAMAVSVVIPALDIPLYNADTVYYNIPVVSAGIQRPSETGQSVVVSGSSVSEIEVNAADKTDIQIDRSKSTRVVLWSMYIVVCAISLVIMAVRIVSVRRLRSRCIVTRFAAYSLAENDGIKSPFSFLRTIFIGSGYSGRQREQIIVHEASHVRHYHSAERIVMETLRAIVWFNPFVWLADRSLVEIQEWEADRDVLDAGYGIDEYRTLIFRQIFGYNPDITCGLVNHLPIKKRFVMMTHKNRGRRSLWRLGYALPLTAGLMLLCSFTTKTIPTNGDSIQRDLTFIGDGSGLVFSTSKDTLRLNADVAYTLNPNADTVILKGNVRIIRDKNFSIQCDSVVVLHNSMPQILVYGKREGDFGVVIRLENKLIVADQLKIPQDSDDGILGFSGANVICSSIVNPVIGAKGFVGHYGVRKHPIFDKEYSHSGVDITAAEGAPVVAVMSGVVDTAMYNGEYGNYIVLRHENGLRTRYAHLAKMNVRSGESVKRGQQIASVGKTGRATGPHLHFEMIRSDGSSLNPELIFDFMSASGTDRQTNGSGI